MTSQSSSSGATTHTQQKKRLSLFSFNSSSSTESKENAANNNDSIAPEAKSVSPSATARVPANALVNETDDNSSLHELPSELVGNPECQIFERSVQDSGIFEPGALNRQHSNSIISSTSSGGAPGKRSRSYTHNSISAGSFFKTEDYIPPALDATTSLLNDKDANLDDVEMIYSNRRNSSVIGLNMALGRPLSPSRKSSVYSMHSQPMLQLNTDPGHSQYSQYPHNAQQVHSPVSPPKISSSKSSLSFYSFADMINNDEFARRPSFKTSYSQGIIPTVKSSQNTHNSIPPTFNRNPSLAKNRSSSTSSQLSSQLSSKDKVLKRLTNIKGANAGNGTNNNLTKFLISPESSDSEDQDATSSTSNLTTKNIKPISKVPTSSSVHSDAALAQPPHHRGSGGSRKSVSSASSQASGFIPVLSPNSVLFNDNDSLISTSIGDCLRQTTTEINGH
ncbi:beta-1,6-N-acetylglucosaminyltransferase [Scheffersomyces xylosifermentans]|uniref:beta-1,6-N-acetylglucosaminyltransferase n=1 Tax=Scheffersomyces xylosifermentans TaxID=1304137 RepID=UPI00315D6588